MRSSSNSPSRPAGRGSAVAVHASWTGTSRPLTGSHSRFIQSRGYSRSQRNSMIIVLVRPDACRSNRLIENPDVLVQHGVEGITCFQALGVLSQLIAQALVG